MNACLWTEVLKMPSKYVEMSVSDMEYDGSGWFRKTIGVFAIFGGIALVALGLVLWYSAIMAPSPEASAEELTGTLRWRLKYFACGSGSICAGASAVIAGLTCFDVYVFDFLKP